MDPQQDITMLITGGRGFIGRAVAKLLRCTGYDVVSLDAAPPSVPTANQDGTEIVCDLADTIQLERVFEMHRIGGIIHLAAILPTAAQREPVRATQVNINGSLQLLEMALRFGVQRMVFGSSLSVYGTCPPDQIVSETHRAAPEDLYGAAKLYVEQLGEAYRGAHGLEFLSLRIGRVVGNGAQSTSSAWRSQIFELLGSEGRAEIALPYMGAERILLVHVDDVAKMLVALMRAERPEHSIYNAVCQSVIVSDLKREVEDVNSNISITLGKGQALGNPRLLDSSRFRKEFGFQTVPILEQLRRAAEIKS